jgi:hypothetical protein
VGKARKLTLRTTWQRLRKAVRKRAIKIQLGGYATNHGGTLLTVLVIRYAQPFT